MSRFPKPPKSHTLPGGFRVEIRYLSNRAFAKQYGNCKDYGRSYTVAVNHYRIDIRKDVPYVVLWDTVGHEFQHAATDYANWIRETIVQPFVQEQVEIGDEDD